MDDALSKFMKSRRPCVVERAQWGDGIELEMANHLATTLPPEEYVTSVRALVLAESGVAVLHNPDSSHLLAGGRREPGEALLETLHREVLEEIGCAIANPRLVGFIHFHHLTRRPRGYRYPYPDFLQVIFAARGRQTVRGAVDRDGWEQRVEFVPVPEVRKRAFPESQLLFLDAGLRALQAAA